jgi:hypothetical protein
VARIPHHRPPHAAAVSFLGRLVTGRTTPSSCMTGRGLAIDPAMLEAMMTMGGSLSWEMVHFISEVASERNRE